MRILQISFLSLILHILSQNCLSETLSCPDRITTVKTITGYGIGGPSSCMAECEKDLEEKQAEVLRDLDFSCDSQKTYDSITGKLEKETLCFASKNIEQDSAVPAFSIYPNPKGEPFLNCSCIKQIRISKSCNPVPEEKLDLSKLLCKPVSKEIKFLGGWLSQSGSTAVEIAQAPDQPHSRTYCWATDIVPPGLNLLFGDRLPAGWRVGGGAWDTVYHNPAGGLPIRESGIVGICIQTPIGNCWLGLAQSDVY